MARIAAGYTAVFVNYPGSIGYGQDFVEALTRDCGNLDVLACLEMQRHLVHLGLSSNDRGKRLFSAWSHGGFIGAHLSVRFPNEFDAIHIGGPVIDLPSNFATSDIPDW